MVDYYTHMLIFYDYSVFRIWSKTIKSINVLRLPVINSSRYVIRDVTYGVGDMMLS